MKLLKKVYVELTNVCNKSCSFCAVSDRKKVFMDKDLFLKCAQEVKTVSDHIYFHILGEPTIHPDFFDFVEICNSLDLNVNLVTNGSTMNVIGEKLLQAKIRRITFSLHSFEGSNGKLCDLQSYLQPIIDFVRQNKSIIINLRLWNDGGANAFNDVILSSIEEVLQLDNVYLDISKKFNWREDQKQEKITCYGIKGQLGILSDGTIVPCCIDCNGELALGNISDMSLLSALKSPRAEAMLAGFRQHIAKEDYCKKCGFRRT